MSIRNLALLSALLASNLTLGADALSIAPARPLTSLPTTWNFMGNGGPQTLPYIPMGLSLNGTGQMWARDFKFEEVSRDTPVTRMPERPVRSGGNQ